ncbi:UNKNOWN [Stylonychia lemnae]|uniref:Transmembrane protein n=1 Tax=Stylonychia lemnae TaxID=5949 RepID=A0A078ADI6_STYLE|nr:UNKNOWN [Stylonychia lemnae]|eukprot:CDW80304.1 UNKNOWN [Stylonychia lemnae]
MNSISSQFGSLMYLERAQQIFLKGSNISNVQTGSVIYSVGNTTLNISHTTIDCTQSPYDSKYNTLEYLRTLPVIINFFQPTKKTPVFIKNAMYVASASNQIRNCYQSPQGGAYYLENTTFYDSQNSHYSYNSAQQGGVIYCKYCKLDIKAATLRNNFANLGGSIYAEQISQIQLNNITVRNSSAYIDGGFLYFLSNDLSANKNLSAIDGSDSSSLSFEKTQFPYLKVSGGQFNFTQATRTGGCYFINANYSEFYIENLKSQFHSYVLSTATSYGGVIYILQADKIHIQDSIFMLFNSTNGSFAAIRSVGIQAYISNSYFDQNVKPFNRISIYDPFYSVRSFGALYIENGKQLSLESNIFSNCYFPYWGGAVSLINTKLLENNTIYYSNYAIYGGVFYSALQPESEFNSIQIYNTQAAYEGSGYIIEIQQGNLYFKNLTVQNATAYFYGFFLVQEYPSSYEDIQANLTISPINGAIYITTVNSLTINRFYGVNLFGSPTSLMKSTSVKDLIINNTVIECRDNYYAQFTPKRILQMTISTYNTQLTMQSVIELGNMNSAIFNNLTIQNCNVNQYAIQTSSFQFVVTLIITNSKFKNIKIGGCLSTYGINNLLIENITVQDVDSIKESFINDQGSQLVMKNIHLRNIKQQTGSAIRLLRATLSRNATITNISVTNLTSNAQGAIIYLNSSNLMPFFRLQGIYCQDITSTDSAVLLFINLFSGQILITPEGNKKNYIRRFKSTGNVGLISQENQNLTLSIQDFLFECVDDSNRPQSQYTANKNGLVYFANSFGQLKTQNVVFRNCKQEGSPIMVKFSNFFDNSSIFEYNGAIKGGALACHSSFCKLENTTFKNNTAQNSGGALNFDSNITVILISIIANDNFAGMIKLYYFTQFLDQGGLIFFEKSRQDDYQQANFNITNTSQLRRNTARFGGLIFTDNIYLVMNIVNISAKYVSSTEEGGIFYIFNAKQINISDSNFESFQSNDGGFMMSTATDIEMKITNTVILCDSSSTNEINLQQFQSSQLTTNTKGVLSLSNAKAFTSRNNQFTQCGISSQGGVINLYRSNFTDFQSLYQNNVGLYGGAINVQQSNAIIVQSKFLNNLAKVGGAIYLASESSLILFKCLIKQNQAQTTSGGVYLSTSSILQIDQSQFYENKASENSAIEILRSKANANVTIKNSIFEDNQSEKNTISIMYSSVWIENSQFHNNQANQRSKNILCGFTNITIQGCDFYQTYQDPKQIQIRNYQTTGTFLFLIFDVSIDIYKTRFYGGVSSNGGAIYNSGNSYIYIQESEFLNNYASNGGAIYASGFESIYIGNKTEFSNNQAIEMGEDLHASNSINNITLNNVKIQKASAKNSIYIEQAYLDAENLNISATTPAKDLKNGAGINCNQCKGMRIFKSEMNNLRGIQGGAIYVLDVDLNKGKTDQETNRKFVIENSTFEYCSAYKGGAITFENPQSVQIISSRFQMNYALNGYSSTLKKQGSGGAIYYTCSSTFENCKLNLTGSNIFEENQAQIQGGAIYWDQIQPIIQENMTQFTQNRANQYGDNIACFTQKIAIVTQEIYQNQMIKLGLNSQDDFYQRQLHTLDNLTNFEILQVAKVQSLKSGGEIPKIYIALLDQYNQIVGSDFQSKVRVQVRTTNLDEEAMEYPPVLEGNSDFFSIGGIALIQNVELTGTPGSKYTLNFQSDAIDQNKQSVKEYQASVHKSDSNVNLNVALRLCYIGEQFTVSGKCQECINGFSLIQMTEPGYCQSCPTDKAICNGGSNIGPRPGFWRMNNVTSTFVACMYQQACLGMVPPKNNPVGECAQGYQGILCSECSVGYSRDGDFKCFECPSKIFNILRLSAIILAILVVVIFVIKTSISAAMDQNNVMSIYMKILLNHFQLIMVTASMDFQWSQQIIDFFSQTKKVATFSTQIFSIDCFLDERTSDDINETQKGSRIFFQKMILVALLPFILSIGCYIIWYLIGYFKKELQNKKSKIMSSLVILLFLVHPSIIQYMFYGFNCKSIDGEERLSEDLWVECWKSEHLFWSYFVALPSILVWGLGIPFFAFAILINHRKNLDRQITRQKYGFLYRGFKKEFYYWEIVIMYRKIIIVFVAVFVSNYGAISQALLLFLIQIWQDQEFQNQLTLQLFTTKLLKETFLDYFIE